MPSPTILVTSQVPTDSPAAALAGRTINAPVETIAQAVARIAEARQTGAQPAIRIVYTESRWDRYINPSAVAATFPAVLAVLAELGGHHTTSQAALVAAVLLASVAGFSLTASVVERAR